MSKFFLQKVFFSYNFDELLFILSKNLILMNGEKKELLVKFLEKKSSLPKIIVIYGPTACGKTALSLEVAKMCESEIISTDSRQIYKFLDIGTGKILSHEMQNIPHHLIDFLEPNREYSVAEFKKESEKVIWDLQKKWKIPVLAGGTGLYIDSILYDFDIPEVPASQEIREKYEKIAQEYGSMKVYEELQKIDPEYAQELHPNNLNYVIRALEVKLITGKSKRDFRGNRTAKYDILFLTPYDGKRDILYEKINARVQKMFDDWLVKEVKSILEMWFKETDVALKTIWYKEVCEYLNWKISLEDCISQVQQGNRNYAKRQLTWFRRYEG